MIRTTHNSINLILNNLQSPYKINFGLYFKKFIELDDDFKKLNNYEAKMKELYEKINSNDINNILKRKNDSLKSYLDNLKYKNYEIFEKKLKLKNRMILGIGETTAMEVGMIFDYISGVPFIPASSIKGVVRFIYLKKLIEKITDQELKKKIIEKIKTENGEFEEYLIENAKDTNIYLLFGGDKLIKIKDKDEEYWGNDGIYVGSIIFFDAYPTEKPKLDIDIINVHYKDYYKEGSVAPTDNMEPNLIKFLTVSNDTEFVFRYAIDKDRIQDENTIRDFQNIFLSALTENGLGAKTKIGYGLFKN